MDIITLQILAGISGAIIYGIIALWRSAFEIKQFALAFLMFIGLAAGVESIVVALTDGIAEFSPYKLRVYLSLAGLIYIGLALQYFEQMIKSFTLKPKSSTAIKSDKRADK